MHTRKLVRLKPTVDMMCRHPKPMVVQVEMMMVLMEVMMATSVLVLSLSHSSSKVEL